VRGRWGNQAATGLLGPFAGSFCCYQGGPLCKTPLLEREPKVVTAVLWPPPGHCPLVFQVIFLQNLFIKSSSNYLAGRWFIHFLLGLWPIWLIEMKDVGSFVSETHCWLYIPEGSSCRMKTLPMVLGCGRELRWSVCWNWGGWLNSMRRADVLKYMARANKNPKNMVAKGKIRGWTRRTIYMIEHVCTHKHTHKHKSLQ
jgi:hypothetical protein